MQIKPLIDQIQCPTRKAAGDYTISNCDNGFVVLIPHMKMRRIVLIHVHIDNDSVESTNFRHSKEKALISDMQI